MSTSVYLQPETVHRLLERADWLSGIAGAIALADVDWPIDAI
jgi:hypothetical protein